MVLESVNDCTGILNLVLPVSSGLTTLPKIIINDAFACISIVLEESFGCSKEFDWICVHSASVLTIFQVNTCFQTADKRAIFCDTNILSAYANIKNYNKIEIQGIDEFVESVPKGIFVLALAPTLLQSC